MTDLECIECSTDLEWGQEYQLEGGDDFHAVCPECHHDREGSDR